MIIVEKILQILVQIMILIIIIILLNNLKEYFLVKNKKRVLEIKKTENKTAVQKKNKKEDYV